MSQPRRPYLIVRRPRRRRYVLRTLSSWDDAPAAAAEPAPPPPESLEQRALRRHGRSRRELVAEAAYYIAQRRGFQGGDPDGDWLAAETEIDALLAGPDPA